jgi:uncharacterized Zn finger protein
MQEKQGNDVKREDVKRDGLRPCPHCGEASRLRLAGEFHQVRCLVCGFVMELVLDTERMLRQAWNGSARRSA